MKKVKYLVRKRRFVLDGKWWWDGTYQWTCRSYNTLERVALSANMLNERLGVKLLILMFGSAEFSFIPFAGECYLQQLEKWGLVTKCHWLHLHPNYWYLFLSGKKCSLRNAQQVALMSQILNWVVEVSKIILKWSIRVLKKTLQVLFYWWYENWKHENFLFKEQAWVHVLLLWQNL